MAKGSKIGVSRGKLGNTVLYRVANSNNKEEQGQRAYQGTVKNPKTLSQAEQRVKMTPAVNFYRAFKNEILDHSYEGIKYGARSHSTFMKAALNMVSGFPFVVRGTTDVAPGEYLMSRGSLPSLKYGISEDGLAIECEALATETPQTFGAWAQSVMEYAPFIQNGDQLTFGFIFIDDDNRTFALVRRVILDTTSTDAVATKLATAGITISPDGIVKVQNIDNTVAGAVLILSRPSVAKTTGAVSWQRSSEKMIVNYENADITTLFFSQASYDAAVSSFMAASNKNIQSDWYLNQGKTKSASRNIPHAPVNPDVPAVVTSTYLTTLEETDAMPNVGENVNLREGSDTSLLTIDMISDDYNGLVLKNVTTNTIVEDEYEIEGNKAVFQITYSRVTSGNKVALFRGTKQITGTLTITYMYNP